MMRQSQIHIFQLSTAQFSLLGCIRETVLKKMSRSLTTGCVLANVKWHGKDYN